MNDFNTGTPYAIVTPCHEPDLDRVGLLNASLKKYARIPYHHYLLVADDEHYLFKNLIDSDTSIRTVSSLFPEWAKRVPGQKKIWTGINGQRFSGWILQQLLKIAFAEQAEEAFLLNVDSDTVFIRPFGREHFERNGRLRLCRIPVFYSDGFEPWYVAAAECLATPAYLPGSNQINYVSNLISWRSSIARDMCQHIEKTTGMPWADKLVQFTLMAESVFYGVYVEQILGEEASEHYFDDSSLCCEYWVPKDLNGGQLNNFFNSVKEENIAVMISSKAHIHPDRYKKYLSKVSE